jgi:hypothetical protein
MPRLAGKAVICALSAGIAASLVLTAPTSSRALNARRYLLVLCANAEDARIQAQGAQIARLKAEGDDRDLELVLVAEEKPLTLERRGGFETVLLGKDGGVKIRSASVMSAADLKAVIDAMPMRREEMLQRPLAKTPS